MWKSILISVLAITSCFAGYVQTSRLGSPRTILSGRVDCDKRSIKFSTGNLKGQKPSELTHTADALKAGRYEGGLDQLQQILEKSCTGELLERRAETLQYLGPSRGEGDYPTPLAFQSSSLVRLEEKGRTIEFTVLDKDFKSSFGDLVAYASGGNKSRDCKQTSYDPPADCYKCENPLEAWCNIKKLGRR